MGFGRGKGFTSKVREEMTSYSIKSGGGAARITVSESNPTLANKYGGGASRVTLTEVNPTYTTEVEAPPELVTIGADPINRALSYTYGLTLIEGSNPASEAFTITKVKLYINTAMTGIKIATFYKTNGNTFTARDSEAIADQGTGLKEVEVSIVAQAGDYIGIYYAAGRIDKAETVGQGTWFKAGDQTACVATAFTPLALEIMSLYGEGYV